jgi:hypothetical protein
VETAAAADDDEFLALFPPFSPSAAQFFVRPSTATQRWITHSFIHSFHFNFTHHFTKNSSPAAASPLFP